MDSDCLIKLTKAGLKERVCAAWDVVIPESVRRETVEQAPSLPDAVRIRENLDNGRLRMEGSGAPGVRGEDAVLALHGAGSVDMVATDDARFIRRLRGLRVPYAVPAVLVILLWKSGAFTPAEASDALGELRPFVSAEEHAAATLMLSGGTNP
jgi:hypothetical protein